MKYLDKEEKDIVESFNRGEWKSIDTAEQEKYIRAARKSLIKDKRINIRLTSKDFHDIQLRAMEEGIPYQTLVSSIIHKYNTGLLIPAR